jgi:ketosteroid isomerase-like protein
VSRVAVDAFESLRRLHVAMSTASHFNAGRVEQVLEAAHEDIRVMTVPGVAPGPFCGRDELRDYFARAAAHTFHARAAITEARVTGAGNVFAAGNLVATIQDVTHDLPAWFVYRFRDGKLSSIETYLDVESAHDQADRS